MCYLPLQIQSYILGFLSLWLPLVQIKENNNERLEGNRRIRSENLICWLIPCKVKSAISLSPRLQPQVPETTSSPQLFWLGKDKNILLLALHPMVFLLDPAHTFT